MRTYRPFDHVSRAIYSPGLITAVMLFVIAYMTMFSHALFVQVLPTSMAEEQRDLSAWLLAIGWDLTLLVTMGNPHHIHPAIPWIGAVASGIIVLFFFQAFEGLVAPEKLLLTQRWFTGILAAVIAYIYTRLFHAKHQHQNELEQLPGRIAHAQAALAQTAAEAQQSSAELAQTRAALEQAQAEAEQRRAALEQAQAELAQVAAGAEQSSAGLAQAQAELAQAKASLEQAQADLGQAKRKLAKHEAELVCPYCQQAQENSRSLNTHKGYCEQNPNPTRRRAIKLNGHTHTQAAAI